LNKTTEIIRQSLIEAQEVLKEFLSDSKNIEQMEKAAELISTSINQGGGVFSCGNGGSMCDAMHFAEELTGRFRSNRKPLKAMAISDPSHFTCVANDYGPDFIFSKYLEAWGKSGDVLLAISTSGNSANIIAAVKEAKSKGMKVIGLLGKDGGKLKELVDVPVIVVGKKWSDRIQEVHIKIIHILIECLEAKIS